MVGVLSYNGTISFGISADPAIMDDLTEFREALQSSFEALVKSVAKHHKPAVDKPAPKKKAVRSAGRRKASPRKKAS